MVEKKFSPFPGKNHRTENWPNGAKVSARMGSNQKPTLNPPASAAFGVVLVATTMNQNFQQVNSLLGDTSTRAHRQDRTHTPTTGYGGFGIWCWRTKQRNPSKHPPVPGHWKGRKHPRAQGTPESPAESLLVPWSELKVGWTAGRSLSLSLCLVLSLG